MTIQLLKDNVLVQIHDQMFEGRFFLPELHRDQHDYRLGKVLHVGSEVKEDLEEQEVILDFGGSWVRLHGRLLALVKEHNVLAVLEKTE